MFKEAARGNAGEFREKSQTSEGKGKWSRDITP
jgi:hypothetical protein